MTFADALLNREVWTDQAPCAQTDPDAFFPDKGGTTRHAKTVCRACPVRAECLQYALDNDERYGVWGGLSERELRRVRAGENVIPTAGARGGRPPKNRRAEEVARAS
ncbi:WhiB family transcriptional regulator [Mycolicibacter virginiensis]|uniref:Transcriptional regulator WhiB n=1 Tax=Mycolicibacter virginiensis TaxID=1795032 RepID=A0A9X7IM46_9MYCO|nr:WhiB family transcriptional regulator [Mycolicibacter virginiensis]